jgi:methyltransferase (TIGR00027 family)
MRAAESHRTDHLFHDPYAEAFGAAAPQAFAEELGPHPELSGFGARFATMVAVRTRFYDDYLLASCDSGCRQVVLLAAGLDARAFRLAWPPGTRLFELDLPEVIEFKEEVLTRLEAVPRCKRIVLAADLRQDWTARMIEAGFAGAETTAWLAEGLLRYLSADEASQLLGSVGELSSRGSRLSLNYSSESGSFPLVRAKEMPAMAEFASLRKGGLGENTPDWLTRHGWMVQTHDRAAVAASYGRNLAEHGSGAFLIATRD